MQEGKEQSLLIASFAVIAPGLLRDVSTRASRIGTRMAFVRECLYIFAAIIRRQRYLKRGQTILELS